MHKIGWLATVVVFAGMGFSSALGSPLTSASGPSFGFSLGPRVFERLDIGDPRPSFHGELAASVDLGYGLSKSNRIGVHSSIGGSFFDFDGASIQGNAEDASWTLSAGVDHIVPLGEKQRLFIGGAFQYGEARSWTRTYLLNRAGPENFFAGGRLHCRFDWDVMQHLAMTTDLAASTSGARAFDEVQQVQYRWLAQSVEVSFGLSSTWASR